jgi:ankyrin repeat protein
MDLLLNCDTIQADYLNKNRQTLLARAVTAGHKEIMKHLLEKKLVAVNRKDKLGHTLLLLAS